jgi:hypothetical protein
MRPRRIRRKPIWLAIPAIAATLMLGFALARLAIGSTSLASNPYASYPPAKRAMLERIEQMREEALKKPIPPRHPPPSNWRPAAPPVSIWRLGIFNGAWPVPFSGEAFAANNQWQGIVGNRHLSVYAGAEGRDPSQGLLIVQGESLDLSNPSENAYLAPAHVGSLHIAAAQGQNGQHLTIIAANGTRFTFYITPSCATSQPATTGGACQLIPLSSGKWPISSERQQMLPISLAMLVPVGWIRA